MTDKIDSFVGTAIELYHVGALDFEKACERYMCKGKSKDAPLTEEENHFLDMLDSAQATFEEELYGKTKNHEFVFHLEHFDDDYWHCPRCHERLLSDEFSEEEALSEIKYCYKCGAKIE